MFVENEQLIDWFQHDIVLLAKLNVPEDAGDVHL